MYKGTTHSATRRGCFVALFLEALQHYREGKFSSCTRSGPTRNTAHGLSRNPDKLRLSPLLKEGKGGQHVRQDPPPQRERGTCSKGTGSITRVCRDAVTPVQFSFFGEKAPSLSGRINEIEMWPHLNGMWGHQRNRGESSKKQGAAYEPPLPFSFFTSCCLSLYGGRGGGSASTGGERNIFLVYSRAPLHRSLHKQTSILTTPAFSGPLVKENIHSSSIPR